MAKRRRVPVAEGATGISEADRQRHAAESLRDARKTFASMEFADADHGFFCDARPSYNKNAAEISWDISLAFLRSNLD